MTGSRIANGAVATSNIATGAVTGTTIANNTITGSNIQANTLSGNNISDGSLTSADIAGSNGGGGVLVGTFAFNPGTIAADTCVPETYSVPGIVPGDRLILNVDPNLESGLTAEPSQSFVGSELRFRLCNTSSSPVTGVARNYSYILIRA